MNARQRRILLFEESQSISSDRARAQAIWAQFGVNVATYHQELRTALAHPDAAQVAPSLMRWRELTTPSEKLPDDLRELLLFEARWRPRPGETKAEAVRAKFGVSFATYRSRLNQAITHPAAAAAFPSTVALNKNAKQQEQPDPSPEQDSPHQD